MRTMIEETKSAAPAIKGYHSHIYFDPANVAEIEQAKAICQQAARHFPLDVGKLHKQPVGPHPKGSCQLAFHPDIFGLVIPWLIENRGSLTVFSHPLTGDDYVDHTDHAFWLGRAESLNLNGL